MAPNQQKVNDENDEEDIEDEDDFNVVETVETNVRKDIRSCALRIASELIHSHDEDIKVVMGEDANLEDYAMASNFQMPSEFCSKTGWARRVRGGKSYGATYMTEEYKSICKELFDAGEEDSNKKKGPRETYQCLVEKFKYRYSIPSESEIRNLIGAFIQQKKKANKKNTYDGADADADDSSDDDDDGMTDQNMKVPKLFIDFIEERIDNAVLDGTLEQLKPMAVVGEIKDLFNSEQLAGLNRDKNYTEFRTKFSQLKSSRKLKIEKERKYSAADV